MRLVAIRHDTLGRTIVVPEISAAHYRSSGWRVVSEQPVTVPPAVAGENTTPEG